MVQSLSRQGVVDDIMAQYGYLIVEECHHISAVSFEQVPSSLHRPSGAAKAKEQGQVSNRLIGHGGAENREQTAKRAFDRKVITRLTRFRLI